MRRLLRTFNKIIKIICAAYLTIFSIGFILPTHIRENAISVYEIELSTFTRLWILNISDKT